MTASPVTIEQEQLARIIEEAVLPFQVTDKLSATKQYTFGQTFSEVIVDAVAAHLADRLALSGEPVAWRFKSVIGRWIYTDLAEPVGVSERQPLYLSPLSPDRGEERFYSDEEARRQIANLEAAASGWQARASQANEEIARLGAALEFYAREYSWRSSTVYMCGHSGASSAELDRGDKARAALSQREG